MKQVEAVWAVRLFTSALETRSVVENGGIPALVKLLASPDKDIREQV